MKWRNRFFLLSLIGLVVLLSSFAIMRNKDRSIKDLEVEFSLGNSRFLTAEIVNKMLIQREDSLFFQQKDMVALNKAERDLLAHPMIASAQLYIIPQGRLFAHITERTPLIRVVGEQSYYIDKLGVKFPLSKRYSPEVPLFYGDLSVDNMEETVQLISAISKDDFLSQEFIDLRLEKDQYILGMRSYPFDVVWGKNNAFADKLNKLKRVCAYWSETKDTSIHELNLTYARQVVARHRKGYGK